MNSNIKLLYLLRIHINKIYQTIIKTDMSRNSYYEVVISEKI